MIFYKSGQERKVAFVAGKKVGNAVKRNMAKRLLRALFLKYIHEIKSGSYILIAKASLPNEKFYKVDKAYQSALNKSGLL